MTYPIRIDTTDKWTGTATPQDYIEWVRQCAAEGCEASARELEDLLNAPEDDGQPLPVSMIPQFRRQA